jgi:predicted metal-dependent phosphoesterase TrpH
VGGLGGVATTRVDLHTHSTASDGSIAPAALVQEAARRGLSLLALTDHDTTAGLPEALNAGREHGLPVVPGIELSTDTNEVGELHLLGYGIDPDHAELQAALEAFRRESAARLLRIIARLRELGINLPDEVAHPSHDTHSVGRPHIARALVASGVVGSVQEAFATYLGKGRPAYIPRSKATPEEAIRLVRAAGGLPVMAHPLTLPDYAARLPELIRSGLAGLEAYYGEYTEQQRDELARVAARHGLLATGGSDYHGENFKAGRELGSVHVPEPMVRRFLTALQQSA